MNTSPTGLNQTVLGNLIKTIELYVKVKNQSLLGMPRYTAKDRIERARGLGMLVGQLPDISIDYERVAELAAGVNISRADALPLHGDGAAPLVEGIRSSLDAGKGEGIIETVSTKIDCVDAALRAAKVDPKVWRAVRHVINWWDVTMKGRDGQPVKARNFQIKVWLECRKVDYVEQALVNLTDAVAKVRKPLPPLRKVARDAHMLEISLFDHHFGLLAWGDETGQHYDLKIAERLYLDAVDDILGKATLPIEKIVFPVGQDFFHIDNQLNTTTAGTSEDVDGRLAKVFETGCRAVLSAIDRCASIAPVVVPWVPGNHDRTTSYYLLRYLAAWYRQTDRVDIDTSPKTRKYVNYGVNLLGFTHGSEEAHRDLPTIMATECPEAWSKSECREWHLGHLHKKKQTNFSAGDTFGGVVVRILPSLCGTDAWHYRKGYVRSRRTSEAYLYHPREGHVGTLITSAKS